LKVFITRLTISTIIPIIIVLTLYKLSDTLNHQENSFIRLFPPHATRVFAKRTLHYNSFYIAGLSKEKITLGNYTSIDKVISWDYLLEDSSIQTLLFPGNEALYWSSMKITADENSLYLADISTPALLTTDSDSVNVHRLKSPQLISAVIVPPNRMIGRYYNREQDQSYLEAGDKELPLERFNEGLFAADGLLLYNRQHDRIFYIYTYKNTFINLDPNLQQQYLAHTIDTNSIPKIKVASVHDETTLAAPPAVVNKKACTYGDYLFIHSALRANNEDRASFGNNYVIDVYETATGRYFRSFYLPPEHGKKLTYFEVFDEKIVALYDDVLIVYTLELLERR
jgi:hypothetical protein